MTGTRARIGLAAGAAVLAIAASGCGGSSTTSGPPASSQGGTAVAFSRCMRSHGVGRFPDPGGSGSIPKVGLDRLGVSSARYQAAQSACRHLLPNGGRPPDQAQRERVRAQGLAFARCVRAHGVPSFPDPDSTGRIPDPARVGIDQGAPAFRAANDACAADRPPYVPSNAAYAAWARAHSGGGG